jgi:hypothetical protein
MKYFILAACLSFGIGAQAQQEAAPAATTTQTKAQRKSTPEERAMRLTRLMSSKVKLNDEQLKQVNQILLERENAKESALKAYNGDKEKARKDIRGSRAKAEAKLKEVLTDEQWKTWQQFKEEQKNKKQQKMSGENQGKAPQKIDEEDFY